MGTPKKPDWARHVTFVVDARESPMVVCRMPEERVPWKTVLAALAAIARHYGAKNARKAISGLSGEAGILDSVIDDPAAGKLPEFELWKWNPSSLTFELVRAKIEPGTPTAEG